jgi:hypothetical protein
MKVLKNRLIHELCYLKKNLQKIWFWDKEIDKQTKIAIHMNLWKYGKILTIQK